MTDRFDEDHARFQEMLDGAMEVFATTQEVLQGTLNRLKAEAAVQGNEIGKEIRDLNSVLMLALSLEAKARDATGQRQERRGAGQLDLDGARAEIGVRLACLRAAGGGGGLSGGAE